MVKELIETINENRADIAILSETNHDLNNGDSIRSIQNTFSDFEVEHKVTTGTSISRILILIKKELSFERVKEFEAYVNFSIVIEIIQSSRKHTFLIGSYRQWKGIGSFQFQSESITDQVFRMKCLFETFQKVINLGAPVFIGGDLNIDRHLPNDPLARPDLKELYPLLDDFMTINNITQIN